MLVETRYGEMDCLDGDSIVSRSLQLYGEWAQLEIDVIAKFVRPNDTVLDIGAFLGTHTLALASLVGAGGQVHSFEPRQAIRQILDGNVLRNGLTQVETHACAIGRTDSEVKVRALDTGAVQNFGGLALNELADDATSTSTPMSAAASETISIRPLDGFHFDRLDFIKIDAEGMEADALLGGRETISRHRPVIFAECNDLDKGIQTFFALQEMGYQVFGVLSNAFNPDNLNQQMENIFPFAAEASLVAIAPERMADLPSPNDLCVSFPVIDSADSLSLLLLHKPQYSEEVLAHSSAAAALGLEFETRQSRRRSVELLELRAAHDALQKENLLLRQAVLTLESIVANLEAVMAKWSGLRRWISSIRRS